VVFVLLEGMQAASVMHSSGGDSLTPSLDALAGDNLYFARFFANGAHTPRALDAVLCGLYPRLLGAPLSRAQPTIPLRCLPSILHDEGYQTAFVHGGLQSFENRVEFLGHVGFHETRFFEQFGANLPRANGGWGGTDAQTFDEALRWLDTRDSSRPFFLTVLTISNHHPFHVPDPALEIDHDPDLLWRNTIRYADREAGRFVKELRARKLLDNTYVFILGDHGLTRSNLKGDETTSLPARLLQRASIPLVVIGPPGTLPRKRVEAVASQVDLMPTVLDLLELDVPNHALGQSLGSTLTGGGHDLPVFVHDVYSEIVATIEPGRMQVFPLDEAGQQQADQTGLATNAAWRTTPEGFEVDAAAKDAASEKRIREIVAAVDALYRTETWWSPGLGLIKAQ
jgi:phosphoglycerol transferase MdoB-like AlkP superfamily enzyme